MMDKTILKVLLNDGIEVPGIGFGTYMLKGTEGVRAIKNAIDIGYRLLDTAFNYENEGTVGEAVRQSLIPREELLICSKLPGRHHAYQKAIETIQESLYRGGLEYYDLYLIHWPNPSVNLYVEAWQALIEAKKQGLVRSIGVCNFLPEHIERLIKETGVKPSINQIELYPYFNQEEQRRWHVEHDIVTESWSPLGRGNSILENKKIAEIAKMHQKSISQVILRWHVQCGAIPIPKASSQKHQRDNLDIFNFQLTREEMEVISGLTSETGRTKNQDPRTYEEF
ncbi:aldo/keto reductase [Pelosinus propionicus]|uniref:Aldo/keto reductase n=1 Tax=Pelosinus propionicus DSM 13327 TaxID=1123291 RepID=A0A1I4MDY3_9FIRM|nr:aldo/keto reductase [Pelosinus propionicus]SFM01253.1 Aldo/keto reductase [Pelosinus propionicus DSM 13327]